MWPFEKKLTYEEKIKKLTDLEFRCQERKFETWKEVTGMSESLSYSTKPSVVSHYCIYSKKLGDISLGDSPQQAWAIAFKILGI